MDREIRAKQLIEDELFQEAFDATKEQLINEWLNTEPFDNERRESLHRSVKLVDRIYAHVTSVLETGQVAQLQRNHPFI